MALPKAKIELKYVVRKEDPRRLAERFGGRVAFPDVKALAQQAVGYEREKNFLNEISQNSVYDKAVHRDIQKRIRTAGLEKENTIRLMMGAQSEEERDFYNQKLKVLDNLLNELKADLNRSALSMEYLNDMSKKGSLEKSRQDEIANDIFKQPPAMDFSRETPFKLEKSVMSPLKLEQSEYLSSEDLDDFGELTSHEDSLKSPPPSAPAEDDRLIAKRERDRLYDDFKSQRISRGQLKSALESIRDRFNIRNEVYYQLKSFE
jgi:hypothetical protein